MDAPLRIERLEPQFTETINPRASLGFIGLSTDRASLPDFRAFLDPFEGVGIHATRIPFEPVATPESLAAMVGYLAAGAEQLVPGQPLDSISFSCTSGTVAMGTDAVQSEVQRVRPNVPVATPIDGAFEALRALGCRRISLLMPYLMSTAEMVAAHFEVHGFSLDRIATFDLGGDPEMNRFDPARIIDAGVDVCAPDSDGLFISCTGWRTQPVIDALEEALDRPVVTSNQALAWQALRRAGVADQCNDQGSLFRSH